MFSGFNVIVIVIEYKYYTLITIRLALIGQYPEKKVARTQKCKELKTNKLKNSQTGINRSWILIFGLPNMV